MRHIPSISFYFFLASILSVFLLSGDLLALVGYDFSLEGGSFIYKVHPAFYFIFLGFLVLLLYKGSFNFLFCLFFLRKNLLVLCLCVFCFIYQAVFLSQPMAPFIVTWLMPILLVFLFDYLSNRQVEIVTKFVLYLIIINSVVALVEYTSGAPVVPRSYFSMEENELLDISDWDFDRSVAFYGHPLVATLSASVVVVGLYAKSNVESLSFAELFCFCITLLALPAFGGRTAIAVSVVLLIFISLFKLKRIVTGYGISRVNFLLVTMLVFSIPFVLLLLFNLGLFDSLIDRIQDDNGSAETRFTAFYIFFDTSFSELVFGDYNKQLFSRQLLYGTKYGIEIFWLAIILQFGLIISLVLVYLLFFIIRQIYLSVGIFTLWSSLAFLLAISSGTGLASKTLSLSHFVLISLFVLRPKLRYTQPNL